MDAPRIAFLHASWHLELVDRIREGFLAGLGERSVGADRVDVVAVPGAFELPLHAKRLASSGRYDAIVCAGLVVDGGIYRHEFVAGAVVSGLMEVQLATDVPVLSAVLTPHHFHEHADHQAFFHAHLEGKGREAAQACVGTVEGLRALDAAAA